MKLHIKAITLGLVADVILSFVGSSILLIPFGVDVESLSMYVWSLILGLAATTGGGYVTSWKSPDSKIFNVVIFAALGMLLGLAIAMSISIPLWFNVASVILVPLTALFGAYIEMHR